MMNLKETPYWNIYEDLFNYHKEFMPVINSDEYWDALMDKGNILADKYRHTPQKEFVLDMVVVVQQELQRAWMKGAKRQC